MYGQTTLTRRCTTLVSGFPMKMDLYTVWDMSELRSLSRRRHHVIVLKMLYKLAPMLKIYIYWHKCYFGHGDERTNEQPGEPRASPLLDSEQS